MPPSRPCLLVLFLTHLWEVGCPPCLAGLASLRDWRGSFLYSELIPSIVERSALFVKELSFPQTAPTDDAFFNRNWARACWNRWAGPARSGCWTPLQKQEIKRIGGGGGGGSHVASLMPKSVPSEERKDQLLRRLIFCVPFTDGVAWYL